MKAVGRVSCRSDSHLYEQVMYDLARCLDPGKS